MNAGLQAGVGGSGWCGGRLSVRPSGSWWPRGGVARSGGWRPREPPAPPGLAACLPALPLPLMTLASSCYFLGPRCRISDVVGFGRGGRQLINVNMEVDWQYPMRREMQEILPGLYLGPYSAATKSRFNTLLDHGITHIICIRQSIESHMVRANFPDKIKYLILDMADNLTQNLISHVAECRTFIDECLASGGKCLVHGNLGISRSAALVVAYVMEKRTLSYREALEFVQNRRYCINPNDGFKQQLMEYEAIYKAQQTLLNGQCSQEKGKLKRKHDQTFDDFDQDSSEPMESVS